MGVPPPGGVIQIYLIENLVIMTKHCNSTLIFPPHFFKLMKQILVLTLFQFIVVIFFASSSENFDTGADHFLVKTPFT